MKKTTLLLIGGTFLFVGYKNLPSGKTELPGTMSNGAPSASTGAPNEKQCSSVGCHSDFQVNAGTAELSFSIENNVTRYEPGKAYLISVSITDSNIVRFGFQVVALKNSDNTNAGTIKLLETQRTQIIEGYGDISDRKYITYTYSGSSAVYTGLGKWSFEWIAPAMNEGDVSFYIASIAANNDGTDADDYSYSKKITIEAPPFSWNVFPTVSSGHFTIQSSGIKFEKISVYDLSGKNVYERSENLQTENSNLQLTQPSGVYVLVVAHDGIIEKKKIVITQ